MMEVRNQELEAIYDKRKSFYRKAIIDKDKLYSYGTLAMEIIDYQPIIYNMQSQITLRHIKEFLKTTGGFKAESKKQIEKIITNFNISGRSKKQGFLIDFPVFFISVIINIIFSKTTSIFAR